MLVCDIVKEVGQNIRKYRTTRNMSQEELAHLAGITTSYLGQIERGVNNTTLVTLQKIADGLSIEPAQLLQFDRRTGRGAPGIQLSMYQSQFDQLTPERQREFVGLLKMLLDIGVGWTEE